MKKKYNLEWYVLNECRIYDDRKKFDEFPYSFHDTNVRPWNVFNNWPFRESVIKLAKMYKKQKIREYALERCIFEDIEKKLKKMKDYEIFKYLLLRELSYYESSRCEYEITVGHWPPDFYNKEGKRISVYYGQEHEPIEDVSLDKVDCYMQVLPNIDIFTKYILTTVNGNLEQDENPKKKKKCTLVKNTLKNKNVKVDKDGLMSYSVKIKPIEATPTLSGKDALAIVKEAQKKPTKKAIARNEKILKLRKKATKKKVNKNGRK